MASAFVPPRKPAVIRGFNAAARLLQGAGIHRPALDPASLERAARRKTGLADFGEPDYRDGLARLVHGLDAQAGLSQLGRVAARFYLVDLLTVRLRLQAYLGQHPELAAQPVAPPLVILGLPRTGSTILYELMAQDTRFRSPASWEVANPLSATGGEAAVARQIRGTERLFALLQLLSPGFNAVHAIGARLPQECVYLMASHFSSELFCYMYNLPEYRDWLLRRDMTGTYNWHADFLRVLQSCGTGEHWLLKAPAHLPHIAALLACYPDAVVVWTHRRPLDAVSSFASLSVRLKAGFSDSVESRDIGAQEMHFLGESVRAGMEQREALGEDRFLDVSFRAICRDPIAVIRAIYDRCDWTLDDAALARMQRYLAAHPRNLHGEHRYASEMFGLCAAQEADVFRDYLSRFHDFL